MRASFCGRVIDLRMSIDSRVERGYVVRTSGEWLYEQEPENSMFRYGTSQDLIDASLFPDRRSATEAVKRYGDDSYYIRAASETTTVKLGP